MVNLTDKGLRQIILALLALYLFVYPFAIVLIGLDRVPAWGSWMGGALLVLQGSMMGLWLSMRAGRRGALAATLVLLLSWAIEHVGATTGFPFGAYHYTEVLQPHILTVVPLAIPFAWLLIVVASLDLAEWLLRREGARAAHQRGFVAASLALMIDLIIEPFAVHINRYWVWQGGTLDGYYGIPLSNFAAWWVTSLLLVWLVLALRQPADRAEPVRPPLAWLPIALYILNLAMFAIVNVARGQHLAGAIGGLLLLALAANTKFQQ